MNFKLVPTQGGYQKTLPATLVKETRTEYHARAEHEVNVRRFRKVDGMPVLRYDRQFPCYKLVVQTTAEEIADLFGNNGMNFADCIFGTDLPTTCLNFGAFVEHKPDTTETHRYQFDDGSAIVIAGDAWDIEGKELFSFAGNK